METTFEEDLTPPQLQRADLDGPSSGADDEKEKQIVALKAVKQSLLKRKRRAARIRNALVKKSNILKIKLWQRSLPLNHEEMRQPSPPPPLADPTPSPSPSPSPSPPPSMSHRFSPDITQYRRKPLLLVPKPRLESPTKSSSCTDDSESEQEDKHNEADESGDLISLKSARSDNESVENCTPEDASILLCDKGQPVVQLDASFVEDFLQSGKPIRAAALAALEAVHGKKMTEAEALQRLRKAYIAKPSLPRGRGRRSICKKTTRPIRGPKLGNWCSVVKSLTYENAYYQVGDVVFVIGEDKRVYFLQIQSLMMDNNEFEAYASMLWLTPKPEFEGPRFPFHPKNYNLRRDIPALDCSLSNVTHVLHCPLDYFEGHPSYWQPIPGTVYQTLGQPLVKWDKLVDRKKPEIPPAPVAVPAAIPENETSEKMEEEVQSETVKEEQPDSVDVNMVQDEDAEALPEPDSPGALKEVAEHSEEPCENTENATTSDAAPDSPLPFFEREGSSAITPTIEIEIETSS